MASDATHGLVVQAAGTTTTAETAIGTVTLPTRGTPWKLHNVAAQVVRATATAAESIGGYVRLNSVSGDITPDPSPSKWPAFERGSFLGLTAGVSTCPLFNYPIDFDAAGKASIDLNSNMTIAATVAPRWTAGIAFGPNIPVVPPFKFCDTVRTTFTAAARAQVGTITLSEKATRIVGILGFLRQDNILTTAEELTGYFDLASDDADLVPSDWMFNEVFGAGLGATISGGQGMPPMPHIVDIPVPGGARIDVYVTPAVAVTNAADVEIFLMYV